MIHNGPHITSQRTGDLTVAIDVSRVQADGGTVVDQTGAARVWEAVSPYDPSLVNFCRAGKSGVLYSLIPT